MPAVMQYVCMCRSHDMACISASYYCMLCVLCVGHVMCGIIKLVVGNVHIVVHDHVYINGA